MCKRTPAGRWGEPPEIAGLAVFLASAAADYMTGQLLVMDGGMSVALKRAKGPSVGNLDDVTSALRLCSRNCNCGIRRPPLGPGSKMQGRSLAARESTMAGR